MAYKMIVAVISDEDRGQLTDALVARGFSATRLSSTGSFLRKGNTTLLLGVEEQNLPKVLSIIKEQCQSRQQLVPELWLAESGVEPNFPNRLSVNVGGATVFVIDVDQFLKM